MKMTKTKEPAEAELVKEKPKKNNDRAQLQLRPFYFNGTYR
jgi:hypothetical protein